ncbi:MAG: hypothetical protein KDB27_21730 [Planctomycetales bacterium]|nr:hypothetical protein [Planctomycetales bacterium]
MQSYEINVSIELDEALVIGKDSTLSLHGPATVSLNGIMLNDRASLKSESPLSLRGSVFVGQNTTIAAVDNNTVDFEANGKLVATSENARLNFVGIPNLDSFHQRTVEVPANTSLAVTVEGLDSTLLITGTNNLLKGGGRINQSIALDTGVSILVGDDNTIGTLTIDGNLSMTKGSMVFDFLDASGTVGVGWDAIEVGDQFTLPTSGSFNLVVQGAADQGSILNFDASESASWQLVTGTVANPEAISRARLVTRGFDEESFPRGGRLLAVADGSGVFLQYRFVPGDFNGNGTIDAADIDLLSNQIRSESYDADFDLVADGQVDSLDHEFWVNSLANTYFGDANLDGEFNSSDFTLVFAAARYETGPADWASGDWNGDGLFDSSDFVVFFKQGGYERGPRRTSAVPEPITWWLPVFAAAASVCRCRCDSSQLLEN